MCGLVGIAGALENKDEDAMRRLLLLDWFRGKESTGLAAVRNNGDVKIAKVASHPVDLFEMSSFRSALIGSSSTVFLGHNRAATSGRVNSFNAHPFQFEHIVGAHNGTLWDRSHKELEKMCGFSCPVDSMALIAAIAQEGIEEVVNVLSGSYAISYVDLRNGTLNFLRNKDRPLWWGSTKDGKLVYWASEWPIIRGAMNGEYRDLFYTDEGHCFFGFDEDIHYSFDLESLRKGGGRPKPRVKKMEGKKSGFFNSGKNGHHTGIHDPFKRTNDGKVLRLPSRTGGTTLSTTTSLSSTKTGQKSPIIVHLSGTEKDPFAGRITRDRFEDLARQGCNFCQTPINWGDRGIAIYDKQNIILCPEHSPPGVTDGIRIYMPELPAA